QFVFRFIGNIWEIRFGTEHGRFGDKKGFQHLAELVSRPYRPISGLALQGGNDADFPKTSNQVVLDEQASKALEDSLRDYASRIAKARADNDTATAQVLSAEFKQIAAQA